MVLAVMALGNVRQNKDGNQCEMLAAGTAAGLLAESIHSREMATIATGNVGTVGLTVSIAITGNAATCLVGTIASASTFAVTGNASTLAVGSVTQSLDKEAIGNAATGAVNTRLASPAPHQSVAMRPLALLAR
jgi:hypothetical protein